MKKIFSILLVIGFLSIAAQTIPTKYTSSSGSNTALRISTGFTNLKGLNVINWYSDSLKVCLYDKLTTATYTDTPVFPTITVPPFGQSFLPYNPYYTYRNGVQFRVTKGGNTGRSDTYTVSPTVSPKVEAEY